jgi:DNA repair protein RadC
MTQQQHVFDFSQVYEQRDEHDGHIPCPSALTLHELLTLALDARKPEQVAALLRRYENLRNLALAHPHDLIDLGLSSRLRTRLVAVFELARRFSEEPWRHGTLFRGSSDIYNHFKERLAAERHELFLAVLLDNKHRKLRDVVVSVGSLTASLVHPRDVFVRVVRESAAAVVFVHNHPSGDPTPSREDIEITRRLREAGDLLGVRILDHIIIGAGRYVSFVDDGYW